MTWRWSPEFSESEMKCRCGCGMLPPADFMDKLVALRRACGFALPVTSGARCPSHNEKVSATKSRTGPHTRGAVDIAVSHDKAFALMRKAIEAGATGVGLNQKGGSRFVHIDWLPNGEGQPRPHVWSY